jgi:hypothetical protein
MSAMVLSFGPASTFHSTTTSRAVSFLSNDVSIAAVVAAMLAGRTPSVESGVRP